MSDTNAYHYKVAVTCYGHTQNHIFYLYWSIITIIDLEGINTETQAQKLLWFN